MLSRQEIYDKVAAHLLTQMKQSKDGHSCAYRNASGLKCGIGALIPDELYTPDIEGSSACPVYDGAKRIVQALWTDKHRLMMQVGVAAGFISSLVPDQVEHTFLKDLQIIHDDNFPEDWQERLTIFAQARGLVPYGR